MEYAQYLVDRGVARFERGHWQLPLQLHEQGLPKTLGSIIDSRIAELSADAKALAVGLAIARDESRSAWQPELHIQLEHYAELLDRPDPARGSAALNELLRTGIVQQRDTYYVLSQRAMVDALVRSADEHLQKETHSRLARIFSKPGYLSSWFAIRHMQRAGEHQRARNAIVEYASSPRIDFSAMRVSVQSQCAKTAVEHWQTEGGTPKEGLALRRLLLTTATVYDWSLARFGEAQLAQLRHDSGLSYWDQIEGTSNGLERLGECLKRAQQVYDQTPEVARGVPPLQALIDFAGTSILLGKAYGYSFDVARMRELYRCSTRSGR